MSTAATPKSVLVALDGSAAAQAAATVAVQIAGGEGLAIRGLYVVDEALIMDPYASYQAELGTGGERASRTDLVAQFRQRGDATLAWLAECCRTANVPRTVEVVMGSVEEVILREAAQTALLALGRRGHGHAADATHLGRHFRGLAHHAPCSMIVGGDQARALRRILLALDGGERRRDAFVWAARLQRSLQAEVLVLSVREASGTGGDEAHQSLTSDERARFRLLTREGEPAAEIVAAAAEHEVDCILMGGYRHSAVVQWLVGSIVEKVLTQIQLPVLLA